MHVLGAAGRGGGGQAGLFTQTDISGRYIHNIKIVRAISNSSCVHAIIVVHFAVVVECFCDGRSVIRRSTLQQICCSGTYLLPSRTPDDTFHARCASRILCCLCNTCHVLCIASSLPTCYRRPRRFHTINTAVTSKNEMIDPCRCAHIFKQRARSMSIHRVQLLIPGIERRTTYPRQRHFHFNSESLI